MILYLKYVIIAAFVVGLPELTSSVNLVRIKNFNADFGNVVGSNLFNFTILCFGALLYMGGSIFVSERQAFLMVCFGTASTIFASVSLFLKKNILMTRCAGFLITASYTASIVMSV